METQTMQIPEQKYNQILTTEELEKRVFQLDGIESADTMADRAAIIEKKYRGIDTDYSGTFGAVRRCLDTAGITSFETRLNDRLKKGAKTRRALESIIGEVTKESTALSREIAETETRQIYAHALMGRYERMIVDIDDKIDEKTQQYDAIVGQSAENPESFGCETLAEEINNLGVDKANIKNRYDEAAVVVIGSEYQAGALKGKRARRDGQANKIRTSMLRGKIRLDLLEMYRPSKISPYRAAKTVQEMERQIAEVDGINEELGSLLEETLDVYKGLDIDSVDDKRAAQRTARITDAVAEEKDIWGAKAKQIMEAKRLAS